MKIKTIFAMLAFLPALYSCQSEAPQESKTDKKEFRVRAYIDTPEDTRAAIEYAYQDSTKEIFTWLDAYNKDSVSYAEDYITLFNISKFSEYHQSKTAPMMYLDKIIGKQAEFVFAPENANETSDLKKFEELMKPGDIILAVVCQAHAANLADCSPGYSNVISYEATSTLYDQVIFENPTTETAMKHVHKMMHMYDVVKVGNDGNLPDLHFKHMNSIFRVTLQNKTGKPLFTKPTDIVFTTSSEDRSTFIYGYNYFSVVGDDDNGFHLEENFKVNSPNTTWLSNKATHKINEKNAIKLPLNDGETYEFYAVVTPRIGGPGFTPEVIKSLTIDLYDGVESGFNVYTDVNKYTITIDNFNRPIERGKRYWFKLTATQEEVGADVNESVNNEKNKTFKLVFTSQYKDPEKNMDDNGEDTSPDE